MSQTPRPSDAPDTDLTQPGRDPGHGDAQPGQTGAPGRDGAQPGTTGVPDDNASPGTPD